MSLSCAALLLALPACEGMGVDDSQSSQEPQFSTQEGALSKNGAAAFVDELSGCAKGCKEMSDACSTDCDSKACVRKCQGARSVCLSECQAEHKIAPGQLGADPESPPLPYMCACPDQEASVKCPGTMSCGACCDGKIAGGGGVGHFCNCGEDWMAFCPSEQTCSDCCAPPDN